MGEEGSAGYLTLKKMHAARSNNVPNNAQRMESLHLTTGNQAGPSQQSTMQKLCALIRLYIEYYPKIATVIFFCFVAAIMAVIVPRLGSPVYRNRLQKNYADISNHYDFKASQIQHWCLWVGHFVQLCRIVLCLLCF